MADTAKELHIDAIGDLDATDRRILQLLQQNGRMTNASLAEAVGLTPTPMLQRIKKLEGRGVILGYTAIVNRNAVGRRTLAYVWVQMAEHKLSAHKRFVESIRSFGEVLECHHISGEEDFLLKVVVRDIEEYEEFLLHRLTSIPGIAKVKTNFVMSSPKVTTEIPVDAQSSN
jgi:Lrp/AsnC family transcriptional regulator, leucine-responsive regulatory protein